MKNLFTLLVTLCATSIMSVATAQCNIVAVEDPSSHYEPTQILNGSFEQTPWMSYYLGGVLYDSYEHRYGEGSWTPIDYSIPNGTNEGWNTSENEVQGGTLFEAGGGQAEMNAVNSAVLYQDLYSNGGDVIRWRLGHKARHDYGDTQQDMRVEVGAPNYSGGAIVYPHGVNDDIDTEINSETQVIYRSSGVTMVGSAFGSGEDLQNLSLDRWSQYDKFYYTSGIYAVPDNQPVTRFGFVAEDVGDQQSGGNYLSGISFSTLIGDVTATYGAGNSVIISGYWGETTSSKKLVVEIGGGQSFEVDMSGVAGKNFTVTIPPSCIGTTLTTVTFYHEDYESAKRTIGVNYPITATAADVNVTHDGNPHGITPIVTEPASGYTIQYGTSYGGITLDNLSYTDVGSYPIYYAVSKPGYTTFKGMATVNILPIMYDLNLAIDGPGMGAVDVQNVLFSDDFESGVLNLSDEWTNDATRPWVIEGNSLRSGNKNQNSTSSTLRATYTFTHDGSISFRYRVYSESCCDKGYFRIDGATKLNKGGDIGWTPSSFAVTAGTHTFEWEYTKDVSVSSGDDGFFIDDIFIRESLPFASSIELEENTTIELGATAADGFRFVNWTDEGANELGTENSLSFTMNGNRTVNANFEPDDFAVTLEAGTEDAAHWTISANPAVAGTTVTLTYNGAKKVKSVSLKKVNQPAINVSNANRAEAFAEFNKTPRTKLVFTENLNFMDLTVSEGEIDMNGHSIVNNDALWYIPNNVLGKAITIKNGTLYHMDGMGGWDKFFYGTVILENITSTGTIFTDGHAYIIRGGTYEHIQNCKNNATPGTVTIYDGNFGRFNDNGSYTSGTFYLYGGKYKTDPTANPRATVVIPEGYEVVDNTDSDAATYPYIVKPHDPALIPPAFDWNLYETVKGSEWTFTMAGADVEVHVEYLTDVTLVDNDGDVSTQIATLYASNDAYAMTINRTIYADGCFNTICLPFGVSASELASPSNPLYGYEQLVSFSAAEVTGSGPSMFIDIYVESATAIEAGKPYLISYPSSHPNIVNPTFYPKCIMTETPGNVSHDGVTFQGMFAPVHIEPYTENRMEDYLFLGANDRLYWPADNDSYMRGFRAYFIVHRNTIPPSQAPHGTPARIMTTQQTPTEIENIDSPENDNQKIIRNGVLYILRGEKIYNAQGQLVK